VNDSLFTDVCLLYPPHIIALASIYLAAFYKEKDITPYVSQWFSELNVDMRQVRCFVVTLAFFSSSSTHHSDQQH
jgi:cyclin C